MQFQTHGGSREAKVHPHTEGPVPGAAAQEAGAQEEGTAMLHGWGPGVGGGHTGGPASRSPGSPSRTAFLCTSSFTRLKAKPSLELGDGLLNDQCP